MNSAISERVKNEALYIIDTEKTIREIAVHKDLHERLLLIDEKLFMRVEKILKYHIDVRHIRGGESTRNKYLEQKYS